MVCPKCGSDKVNVQMVQTSANTKTKRKGCLFTLGRWLLIICTLGLWLVFGKKKEKSKTTIISEKHALCSSCGNSWIIN